MDALRKHERKLGRQMTLAETLLKVESVMKDRGIPLRFAPYRDGMSFTKIWSGDWHGRILKRVRQRGFHTVTQYAGERPGISLLELADEIGPDDIAAAQIRSMLVEEAVRTRAVPRVLRDLFVRELRQSLPQGWKHPVDEEARFEITGALAHWEAELQDHLEEERAFEAGQDFLNAELPNGWLPEGPDDPVIIAFIDRCLGRAPS